MPTTTPFQNLITFSRGSNATVTGPDGLIQWAPNNLVTFSEQFDNAAWGKFLSASVTANTTTAPDGTTTADTLTLASTTNSRIEQTVTVASGQTYTFSVWMRVASGTLSVRLYGIDTGVGSAFTVNTSWQRFSITQVASSGTRFPAIVTDGTAGSVFIWGAQLELGSAATTYNPTTVKNLLGFSEAFDNAAWTKVGSSIVTGAQANPVNGLFNAQKLMEGVAFSGHQALQAVVTTASPWTFSVFVKAGGRNWTALGITDSGGTVRITYFDLINGVVGTVATGITASIVAAGNGWYRCAVRVASAVAGSNNLRVYASPADGTTSYTGDGSSGVYIYGAQLSDSASLDPYVPTPGAAPSSTAYYGPRFDYDPVTRQPKGILIEEARTNLLTYSEQFNNAVWLMLGTAGASRTANATTAPDGTSNADRYTVGTGTGAWYIANYANQNIVNGQAYTFSVYIKANGLNFVFVRPHNNSPNLGPSGFIVSLIDGAITYPSSPLAPASTGTATNVGNGWWRITATSTANGTVTPSTGGPGIWPCNSTAFSATSGTAPANFTGDGTSGIYIWGAQLEAGSFATSYIPTIASTVTRSVDVATITGSLFSQWYRQDQGTFVVNLTPIGTPPGATNTRFLEANDGSGNNRKPLLFASPVGATLSQYRVAGVDQALIQQGGTFASGVNLRVATACATDNFAASFNGGAVATDGTGSVANTCTQLTIGYATSVPAGTEVYNGYFRSIDFIPFRSANFQLQAIST